MNIRKTRINSYVVVVISTIVLSVGSSTVFATNDCLGSSRAKKAIHIRVDENNKPYFHDHACPANASPTNAGREKGDVCVELKGKPVMVFQLEGENIKDWELVRMELGENDLNWPGNLPAGAFSDFEFDTDRGLKAGHPYVKLNRKKNRMQVKNNNCHKFVVHYRLVLKDPQGNEQMLHPIIDNKGTGL